MQPHHSPIVRAERPHRVCQDLLQGEQDLLVETTYKVAMSPVGATLSQRGTRHGTTHHDSSHSTDRKPLVRPTGVNEQGSQGWLAPALKAEGPNPLHLCQVCRIPVCHGTLTGKGHTKGRGSWDSTYGLKARSLTPPPYLTHSALSRPTLYSALAQWLPEDVTEKEGSAIPQSPVVIQGVDGGSQWLQDTVEDTAHQGADIGPQTEVWVPNQAPCHLQEPV